VPILLYSSVIVRDGKPRGLRAIALDITAEKESEKALRTSEERHRTVVEDALDAIYTVSPEGRITSLNPAFEIITGWSPSEWIGKPFAPLVHPDDLQKMQDAVKRSVQGDADRVRQARVLSKSGEYVEMEFAGVPLFQNGDLVGYLGIGRDVTDRNRAELALRESEERLRNVFDTSLDMIYRLNLRTSEYDFVSPACRQVLGYTPEEYMAVGFQGGSEMIHPDDLPGLVDNMMRLLNPAEEPSARTVEYRIKHQELEYRWVSDYRAVVYDEQGAPIAVVGSLRDITDRKEAEERLRTSEEHYRALIEKATDVTLILRRDMTIRYVSPSAERTRA
jgi:PAS domain S-box-containing protein